MRPASRVGGAGVEFDLERQLLLIVREGSGTRILSMSMGTGDLTSLGIRAQEYLTMGTQVAVY